MNSQITQLASKYLLPVLIVISVIVFFRGHHHPGGGFIAALIAATAIIFNAMVTETGSVYKRLFSHPVRLVAAGMSFCFLAAFAGLLESRPLFYGYWTEIKLPLVNKISLGTPLLFDAGVFLVVTGSLLTVFLLILEEIEWK
ncbi:MAG: Na(+)/H(+) antiporter subunit B [Cyclobacteriaceae bacterium]|nr:Na(+)/H(+) antiporter subunit B [Cyclobacteriaceae bacterium]